MVSALVSSKILSTPLDRSIDQVAVALIVFDSKSTFAIQFKCETRASAGCANECGSFFIISVFCSSGEHANNEKRKSVNNSHFNFLLILTRKDISLVIKFTFLIITKTILVTIKQIFQGK
jgi:hypothetical protein